VEEGDREERIKKEDTKILCKKEFYCEIAVLGRFIISFTAA
jgi:hypothetical protein